MTRTVASASAVSSWAITGLAWSGRSPATSASATRMKAATRAALRERGCNICGLLSAIDVLSNQSNRDV